VIAAFETRLAEVLGARLPLPFRGRVTQPPLPAASANPDLLVSVEAAEPAQPDFGSVRPELAPGVNDPRRVVRLACDVAVRVRPGTGSGRAQQMAGLDAALYLLDAPDMRDGTALRSGGDPGFLIERMAIVGLDSPADPADPEAEDFAVRLRADGWFWPAGEPGRTGAIITEIRVRGATLPVLVTPAAPELTAGGGPVELTITIGGFGTMIQRGRNAPVTTLPFGMLALTLEAPGGRPGLGTLTGGVAGQPGVRTVAVGEGVAQVNYAPPAEPAFEELIIALEGEPGQIGLEIGRFGLRTRA
jgi:hypothetical protein